MEEQAIDESGEHAALEAAAPDRPNYVLHVGLFVATCYTTYAFGGVAFAATLMGILFVHEMGHYVAARIHRIEASLPYFIPLPPKVTLGTLGAVIRMKNPIADRNKLLDVGAAGPLAGLVVCIPLLVIGLYLSDVGPMSTGGGLIEGNSLGYIALKFAVHGRYLPADGLDVQLHPIAFAAWVGLLITFINLIPIGQLDGGHVARAFFGNRHEMLSGWIHRAMLAVGAVVATWLMLDARTTANYEWWAAAKYGLWGAAPWGVWALLLLGMRRLSGGVYHPPVTEEPLTPGRKRTLWVTAIVFLLIFTPVPLRQPLGATEKPENAVKSAAQRSAALETGPPATVR
jgi:membrane-associated protease RseP (regulator of RpoE activity)